MKTPARPITKAELIARVAADSGADAKLVAGVLDSLAGAIREGLKADGVFTLPGIAKLRVIDKPATPERAGVNPFTREPMTVKAKPAKNVVKVVPLKGLKALVQ